MPMLTMLAFPFTRADLGGELGHPVQDVVHLGDHVDPVDDQRGVFRHTQCHMQNRTVLGHVDRLAGEHRVPALLETALLGQLD